ncbi:MAG: response regulator [Myxococcales bacterium]|jgi:DNA-binding response OmpR family regulator|nr:response regulator [Myxococcales bacterium]
MDSHRQDESDNAGARVLIVEDHPMIAELIETRLRIEGMRPTKSLGGREAIQILGHSDFDLVILDIMMPEVDGYQVFQVLKAQERTASIPVIFLTAKSTQDDIEKGLTLGADYYITKPFSGSDLVRKVKILLEQNRLSHANTPSLSAATTGISS